jgi:hypothetical protein
MLFSTVLGRDVFTTVQIPQINTQIPRFENELNFQQNIYHISSRREVFSCEIISSAFDYYLLISFKNNSFFKSKFLTKKNKTGG